MVPFWNQTISLLASTTPTNTARPFTVINTMQINTASHDRQDFSWHSSLFFINVIFI